MMVWCGIGKETTTESYSVIEPSRNMQFHGQ
jgi:hypothetical protein